jgi:tetratricopeptide (TPR) repeat protein
MSRNARNALIVALIAAGAAVVGYQSRDRGVTVGDAVAAEERTAPPLFENLGSYHRTISTNVADAQRYFDQGLRLTYAFNHAEAIRAFEQATRLDPDCAICYWGIAYAYGPNINAPMDAESGRRAAYAACSEAQEALAGASAVERALIEALATPLRPAAAGDRGRARPGVRGGDGGGEARSFRMTRTS